MNAYYHSLIEEIKKEILCEIEPFKELCPGVRIDLSGTEHALCSRRCIGVIGIL